MFWRELVPSLEQLNGLHPVDQNALAEFHVRLTQLGHDLLGTVSLLHEESFPASGR